MAKQATKTSRITDLIEDDYNANLGSLEGMKILKESVERFGAGRSILVDKNNRIIAGNKTKRTAEESGLEEVIIVKAKANQLVAVMREDIDLDTLEGRSMAIADNRTSEKNLVWDVDNLEKIEDKFSVDLKLHWNETELRSLFS